MNTELKPSVERLSAVEAAVRSLCSSYERGLTFHSAIAEIHSVCDAVQGAIEAECDPAQLQIRLQPAYAIHGASPFVQRLQTWPRGYPGDFETVEWIAKNAPSISGDHPAYWIEWYALNSPIAQQHRNKLAWQRDLIREAADRGGRILNIGCGGCADLADRPKFIAHCEIDLLDMDADALALARERVGHAKSLRVINKDVMRGVRDALASGQYDLILCGGIFDYLSDRVIAKLMSQFYSSLAPEGCVAFTNVSDHNPFRCWIENLTAWRLIHRTADDMRRIASIEDCPDFALNLVKDPSGLTWLCSVKHSGERRPS